MTNRKLANAVGKWHRQPCSVQGCHKPSTGKRCSYLWSTIKWSILKWGLPIFTLDTTERHTESRCSERTGRKSADTESRKALGVGRWERGEGRRTAGRPESLQLCLVSAVPPTPTPAHNKIKQVHSVKPCFFCFLFNPEANSCVYVRNRHPSTFLVANTTGFCARKWSTQPKVMDCDWAEQITTNPFPPPSWPSFSSRVGHVFQFCLGNEPGGASKRETQLTCYRPWTWSR